MSSDMGLLVLQRFLIENADDDGNSHFTRNYNCRMIKFSGSGDVANFKESELMTMHDYNQRSVELQQEREEMRNNMYTITKEIFDSFGVKRNTQVYLKNGDVVDKANIYKVTGYARNSQETILLLRQEAGEGKTTDEVRVKSKSEFELLTKE